ncbi:MAG: hypothetical protein M0R17_05845 [Candidatus Omnitrophica bacterium]|jgi:hypothetical protein|nr:hypothetical protein [Candidatus Omnitrophota bacterium]
MKEMNNKQRFWTGAVMGLFEMVGLGIWGLTQLNWDWITERLILTAFAVSAILLYNVLAGMLILNGSKKMKGGKKNE